MMVFGVMSSIMVLFESVFTDQEDPKDPDSKATIQTSLFTPEPLVWP